MDFLDQDSNSGTDRETDTGIPEQEIHKIKRIPKSQ
jgi:hypothetical protein